MPINYCTYYLYAVLLYAPRTRLFLLPSAERVLRMMFCGDCHRY